jgi:hypothetical protein
MVDTAGMDAADSDMSPLDYLNRVERMICGWYVARVFATNTRTTAKRLSQSGPEATALLACVQVLQLYAAGPIVLGIVGVVARDPAILYACVAVGICCAAAGIALLPSMSRAEKRYKSQSAGWSTTITNRR